MDSGTSREELRWLAWSWSCLLKEVSMWFHFRRVYNWKLFCGFYIWTSTTTGMELTVFTGWSCCCCFCCWCCSCCCWHCCCCCGCYCFIVGQIGTIEHLHHSYSRRPLPFARLRLKWNWLVAAELEHDFILPSLISSALIWTPIFSDFVFLSLGFLWDHLLSVSSFSIFSFFSFLRWLYFSPFFQLSELLNTSF